MALKKKSSFDLAYLGFDFYIFAFHNVIKALLKDSHLDFYVFHPSLKKKNEVKYNPYINTISKLSRFGYDF